MSSTDISTYWSLPADPPSRWFLPVMVIVSLLCLVVVVVVVVVGFGGAGVGLNHGGALRH